MVVEANNGRPLRTRFPQIILMKKILLTSNGLDFFSIINAAVQLLGDYQPDACALINEGSVMETNQGQRWVIEELLRWTTVFQCEIQFTSLSAQSKDVLRGIYTRNDFILGLSWFRVVCF